MVLHKVEVVSSHMGQRLLLQDVLSESFIKYFQVGGACKIRHIKVTLNDIFKK